MSKEDKIKQFGWRLNKYAEQFESYAQENKTSKANSIASKKINEILFENKKIDNNDLQSIKELIDWTEGQIHWDGVSWTDYKMHIRAYLGFKGIEIELEKI